MTKKITKEEMRATNNFSYVDIVADSHDDRTYFAVYFKRGERCWIPPTAVQQREDRKTEQLLALYSAVNSLTRNAIIQLHGFDQLEKDFFKSRHSGNQKAWKAIDAIKEIGLNGHIFDFISCGKSANKNLNKAETWAWTMHDAEAKMHAIKTCVAPSSLKAKADPAPQAKVEKPAAVAKAVKTAA